MSNHEKRQYNTYLKAETYQKNLANFANFVSQNLATPIAKFGKNFRNFLWGVSNRSVTAIIFILVLLVWKGGNCYFYISKNMLMAL